jgi:hypothetical protein
MADEKMKYLGFSTKDNHLSLVTEVSQFFCCYLKSEKAKELVTLKNSDQALIALVISISLLFELKMISFKEYQTLI